MAPHEVLMNWVFVSVGIGLLAKHWFMYVANTVRVMRAVRVEKYEPSIIPISLSLCLSIGVGEFDEI